MSDFKRQHRMLIVIDTLRSAPTYLGLAILSAISRGDSITLMSVIFVAAIAALMLTNIVISALSWRYYYYSYGPGFIHIRQGIIFKKERSIKKERIQSLNVYTNIVQRRFGLATLQIKTAGTEETEVNLRALDLEELESIRSALRSVSENGDGSEAEAPRSVSRLAGRDLWLAGATSGRFLILFSVIAFIASQLIAYMPGSFLDLIIEEVTEIPLTMVAALVLALLVLSYVTSVIVFVVQYYGFSIERFDNRLEMRWGVIKQNHITVGLHRIQALAVEEGLIRQPFGLCSLHIEVAGGGGEGSQEQVSLLHPLIRFKHIPEFLREILPEYIIPGGPVPLPERALSRYLFRALAPTLLLSLLVWRGAHDAGFGYGWLALMLLPPAALLAMSRHANGATSIDGSQLTLKFRDLSRYHVMINKPHMQSLSVSADPIQRYKGLRTLRVPVLSSPYAKSFKLKDIAPSEADRVWRWYSQRKTGK